VAKLLKGLRDADDAEVRNWLDAADIEPGLRPEQIARGKLRALARAVPAEEDA
jgi:hypothetical protein